MSDELPPIPEGFRRISGRSAPPKDGKLYHIQLRMGFTDTRVGYSRDQLRWIWDGSAGDIVSIAEVG